MLSTIIPVAAPDSIFFHNTYTHTHTSIDFESVIGCGDNPCYRNVLPARKRHGVVLLDRSSTELSMITS